MPIRRDPPNSLPTDPEKLKGSAAVDSALIHDIQPCEASWVSAAKKTACAEEAPRDTIAADVASTATTR